MNFSPKCLYFFISLCKVHFFFTNYLEIPKILCNFVADFCGIALFVRLHRVIIG